MAYKVTVITPAYNSAATLPKTFQSLEKQTLGFENIEYIIAFDSSEDATGELARAWEREHANVRAIELSRAKGGPGAARNAALDVASAPYIMFLDADDIFSPNACKTLFEVMEKEDCDIATGDFRTVVYDSKGRLKSAENSFERFPQGLYDLSHGITPAAEPFLSAFWCKIFKRSIIEEHGLRMRARSLFEELMFLCRYLGFCEKGYYIKENITDYTLRGDSSSRARSAYFFKSTAECIAETIALASADGKPQLVADYLKCSDTISEHLMWLLESDLDGEELADTLECWRELLRYCAESSLEVSAPEARLLMDDAFRGADMKRDFYCLREYSRQRKAELEGIFSSNTWKIAKALQRVKGGE